MESKNNQSGSKITRRTALSIIGTVGSIGLAGCTQIGGILEESSSITIINNNTSNTVSTKLLSRNGSEIFNKEYDLKPNASSTKSYTGNASKVIVSINKKKTKTISVPSSFTSSCRAEQIVVSIEKNGSISMTTGCMSHENKNTNTSS